MLALPIVISPTAQTASKTPFKIAENEVKTVVKQRLGYRRSENCRVQLIHETQIGVDHLFGLARFQLMVVVVHALE